MDPIDEERRLVEADAQDVLMQIQAIADGCSLGQMCVVEWRSDGLYCPRCKHAFASVTMDGQAG